MLQRPRADQYSLLFTDKSVQSTAGRPVDTLPNYCKRKHMISRPWGKL